MLKYLKKKPFFALLWLGLLTILLASCSHQHEVMNAGTPHYRHYPEGGGLFVSVAFDADGRLWRVVPEKQHIYVDYSTDFGKTFSPPVRLNAESQKIKVSGENRPGLVVDKVGRVYVVYAAEGSQQPVTLYFSVSTDKGQSFSEPALLSDKSLIANAFQGRLILNPAGQAYVFWHDERDRHTWQQPGNAIYYAQIDAENKRSTVSRQVTDMLCECCRLAVAFDPQANPVLFARFIYAGGIRDHGLIKIGNDGKNERVVRATFDQWQIEACPEHGPALAIDNKGFFHLAWFSQGLHPGLFYAQSTDQGQHISSPIAFGAATKLASHPDIFAEGETVYLTWKEFDGEKTQLQFMQSKNGGKTWQPAKTLAEASGDSDYPFLTHDKHAVFVSWNSKKEGYRLIPVL